MEETLATKRRRKYHNWTDWDKEQLIRDASAQEKELGITEFLRRRQVSPSWFRTMRANYLKEHPQFNPFQPSKELVHLRAPDFRQVPLDQKLLMVQQYDELPVREKQAWRERHNATDALLSYYRRMNGRRGRRHADTRPVVTIVPTEVPVMVSPTLDDAILAMKVKRDQLSSFIEDLERMKHAKR